MGDPSIPEWFRNRTVLVTGATGFMGKVLLYKLLMSCKDIDKIFILIREKRGVSPDDRLQSLIQEEVFSEIRQNYAERLKKLVLIPGNTSSAGLELSEADRTRLIDDVSVIFHFAANVKFDLPLKTAINMNTRGTLNTLELAKQMPKLKAFVHCSTAYCQCGEDVLEEKMYQTQESPEYIMNLVDTLSDSQLEQITPKLLGDQPNTYAFSKALSEVLVSNSGLPIGIARPSIVVASWKEPFPGWIENMNGPTGLMIGAGKGVIRTMLCNGDYLSDVFPCDMAINATIALAWKIGKEPPKATPIFMNITESGENPMTWKLALETGKKHALSHPFSGPLWYPGGGMTTSKVVHLIAVLFLHLIPAYLLDGLIYMTGNKPFLVRVQNKVAAGLDLLQYYTTKQWIFKNNTMKSLQMELKDSDKETFFMDTKAICWDDFLLSYILGTRKYCLKDDPSTLPRARRVFLYLFIADIILRVAIFSLFTWIIYSFLFKSSTVTEAILETHDM